MRNFYTGLFLLANIGVLGAETLNFTCIPHREREAPYRTFYITIFNADTREPQSEISYSVYTDHEAVTPDTGGILNGFYQSETYSTDLSSRYRNITIQGGRMGVTWKRDQLLMNKRRGTFYRASFYFPEGSEQLDLDWNSLLNLDCDRIL